MKKIIIAIVVIAIAGVAGYQYMQYQEEQRIIEETDFKEIDDSDLEGVDEIIENIEELGEKEGNADSYVDIEEEGFSIPLPYFVMMQGEDGYISYNFGSSGFIPEGQDDSERPIYLMRLVEKRDAEFLMNNTGFKDVSFFSYGPETVEVNGFEVIKYSEPGMCDYRALEIIGENSNVVLSTSGCHNEREVDFEYFENIVNGIKSI